MHKKIIILGAFAALLIHGCSNEPEPDQKGLLEINGTELYVESAGKGDPIIVIHGGPVLDHGYLQSHLKDLEEEYRLIYFDQRLSGRSAADVDTADINMDAFVRDIDAIRAHFEYQKVHILGHSWGGLLAMEYALRFGDHVKSLLLINSMPPAFSLWQQEQQILAARSFSRDSIKRQKILGSDLFRQDPPTAIQQLLRLSFKRQLHDTTLVDILEFFIPPDYMARSQKFNQMAAYLFNYDLLDQLENLETKTLILYGKDEPAAEISAPVLHERMQNSSLVLLEECGHFPFLEQPEKFNEALERFLN